ncbi:hypothetical protein T4D_6491 [Trichinella pseudospiralis]|uniref:Uncharacterized protein n=1 Tax=Trichinella pseudospiralis TaxID=6337 RepID=A0A0V1FN64_TRIPS|nr:hypothetical protein T4D_6491 [Trichinella pseudospiralis]
MWKQDLVYFLISVFFRNPIKHTNHSNHLNRVTGLDNKPRSQINDNPQQAINNKLNYHFICVSLYRECENHQTRSTSKYHIIEAS